MKIFKNKYSEVRSGWKILLVFLLMFAMTFGVSIMIGTGYGIYLAAKGVVINQETISQLESNGLFFSINATIQNLCTIAAAFILWKAYEKKKFRNMGLTNFKNSYKEFVFGLIFGAITITVVAIVLMITKQVQITNAITKPNFSVDLLYGIIAFIAVGFGEEILGRGYVMTILKQTRNKYVVLILSSLGFAALHLGNPGITVLAFINLTLAGILFGYMFMKSKKLWMPIGFHITWNYFQGYIWGFEVSGNPVNGLYGLKDVGNSLITGGSFGPEGGIIVTVVILVSIFIISKYYKASTIEEFMLYEGEDLLVIQ